MNKKDHQKLTSSKNSSEIKRRRREAFFIVLIFIIVIVISLLKSKLTLVEMNMPVSNSVVMFVLMIFNLLLLLTLIFLVIRNLVKLYYDRRHKVMGARLRVKLLVAFISLTLLPSIVLFLFSIQFISSSIEYWYNVPIELALDNSLEVGTQLYTYFEENNSFFLERISYQIDKKKYLDKDKKHALERYILISQREFNLHGIEVYDKKSNRLAFAVGPRINTYFLNPISEIGLHKDVDKRKVKTISGSIPIGGEIIRSIGTVPFGVSHEEATAYVVIIVYLPPNLSENLSSISKGVEAYRQNKLYKPTVQTTYYIYLSIVGLLVVFCAIWFAFYLAKTITIPIMELVEGTKRIADGDLSFNINKTSSDEVGSLVDSFNQMTRDLAISQEQLSLSARILKQQNVEIEERRRYMEAVLENVSTGVISLDSDGVITTINKSAEMMLQIKAENVMQKNYMILMGDKEKERAENIKKRIDLNEDVEFRQTLKIQGESKSFVIHCKVLKDDNGKNLGLVAVFDDLTELEKVQRMAAWREVARRIAHEVKNPLTPISLSAQRLERKYSQQINEPVFDECTRTIIDHVELIRNLTNAFARFAKFPAANLEQNNLYEIIEETVALYKEGSENIIFDVSIINDIPSFCLDKQQIKQAMINLLDNAISSINGNGSVCINLKYDSNMHFVKLEVSDTGEGIPKEAKDRLFEPYFSTKKAGTGLGLAIVNSIVADHSATIRVEDNEPSGARFIIEFPV